MATVTISFEAPAELAGQLAPLQDRLPEIIELGLRQWRSLEVGKATETNLPLKRQVLTALRSTGIVTIPEPLVPAQPRVRHTPVKAGGLPASEMIIAERRGTQ